MKNLFQTCCFFPVAPKKIDKWSYHMFSTSLVGIHLSFFWGCRSNPIMVLSLAYTMALWVPHLTISKWRDVASWITSGIPGFNCHGFSTWSWTFHGVQPQKPSSPEDLTMDFSMDLRRHAAPSIPSLGQRKGPGPAGNRRKWPSLMTSKSSMRTKKINIFVGLSVFVALLA